MPKVEFTGPAVARRKNESGRLVMPAPEDEEENVDLVVEFLCHVNGLPLEAGESEGSILRPCRRLGDCRDDVGAQARRCVLYGEGDAPFDDEVGVYGEELVHADRVFNDVVDDELFNHGRILRADIARV